MMILKTNSPRGDISVKVSNSSQDILEVVVRDTNENVSIEGKAYAKYRIVKPGGLEGEEIFHRPERGYEALLSVVFTALAESKPKK